jgi:mRNA interferase MazF
VCPITNQSKGYPFEVEVIGANKTRGVILTDQLKSLDKDAKNLYIVDKVSDDCLKDVKALIATVLST